MELHVVPVLLGGGARLLDDVGYAGLESDRVITSPTVTHYRFRLSA